jgi:predicted RNA-binding protein YlxR (DUF448 family)/ribosomal protein L30E
MTAEAAPRGRNRPDSAGRQAQGARRTDGRAAPERRCLASGEVLPKAQLLRFVIDPEGVVVPDFAGQLPGRGLWLQPRHDMIAKACARNLFAKAAKRQVRVPEDLPQRIEALAQKRCLDLLGLARRAGAVAVGFEKVKSALRAGEIGVLLQAADAADDGRQKIQALARAVGPSVPQVQLCGAAELGAAVGREAAVHVGVKSGRFAEGLKREVLRLAAVRGVVDQENGILRPTEGER